jgi:hypothetical protein
LCPTADPISKILFSLNIGGLKGLNPLALVEPSLVLS